MKSVFRVQTSHPKTEADTCLVPLLCREQVQLAYSAGIWKTDLDKLLWLAHGVCCHIAISTLTELRDCARALHWQLT